MGRKMKFDIRKGEEQRRQIQQLKKRGRPKKCPMMTQV